MPLIFILQEAFFFDQPLINDFLFLLLYLHTFPQRLHSFSQRTTFLFFENAFIPQFAECSMLHLLFSMAYADILGSKDHDLLWFLDLNWNHCDLAFWITNIFYISLTNINHFSNYYLHRCQMQLFSHMELSSQHSEQWINPIFLSERSTPCTSLHRI